ncbi:MAG: helix-turn-helix domain-containing protein [Bacteroides acidifaciens]|uniref:helix-turn-helix domain-containing protein n=1 Tax=Bacteroides acidifaciens TaxID=85831 RepID=UPI0023C841DC|nr:helix-turn-helix domain-containing protein [Bacteroides acidifaciens]MDE6821383.1 helix-turn-helix domain-containing protein [Bacteroides acidifaciens]MDE6986542.1 helix-turn-helix domain-containing protein [Bacteroides acidifaciens]
MITIESLVDMGANVKLEVTPTDLKMFAESIIQRTIVAQQEEQQAAMQREAQEAYLNTKQVRELLNVCEGTLNLWAKRGYLVPVKVGNKNMYAKSDVRRVQTGGKSESVTSYCKKKNGRHEKQPA